MICVCVCAAGRVAIAGSLQLMDKGHHKGHFAHIIRDTIAVKCVANDGRPDRCCPKWWQS